MAQYTDAVQLYQFFGTGATLAVEVEATADILFLGGRLADAGTGSTALLDSVYFPNGGQLEAFGLIITEAITNTNTTRCIVKVQYVSTFGASASAAATINVPNANDFTVGNASTSYDSTNGITGPNVRPQGTTTTIAKAVGSRIVHPGFTTTTGPSAKVLPFKLAPGSNIYVEVTQAGGAAGGAFNAFVICRHNSSIFPTDGSLGAATGSAVSLAPIAS